MLIELLSTSNYVSFNTRLAQILGLHSAIYLSQIMDINEKAIRKNKTDGEFFTVDRSYIAKRTTIEEKEQKEIEKNLLKVGVLERSKTDPNTIQLNITVLTSIIMSPDEDLVKDISQTVHEKTKQQQKQKQIVKQLKERVVTLNPELQSAYYCWIDSVVEKQGWMTSASVTNAQRAIDAFSNRNLDIALKVLEIAQNSGYRDIQWAINAYKKDYQVDVEVQKTTMAEPIVLRRATRLSTEEF